MARAFWKGSISFGLVEIPVTLTPATQSNDLSFSLLDRKDFSPVGYKRYNKNSGRDVPWDEIVRGYEYERDEYVVLSDEELRQANVEATQTIDILEFVQREEIDPLFFETPYYVAPLKRGSCCSLLAMISEQPNSLSACDPRGSRPSTPSRPPKRRLKRCRAAAFSSTGSSTCSPAPSTSRFIIRSSPRSMPESWSVS